MPSNIQEHRFGFVTEVSRIFKVSLLFSFFFLLVLVIEIYKYNRRKEIKLRKTAVIVSVFVTLLVTA